MTWEPIKSPTLPTTTRQIFRQSLLTTFRIVAMRIRSCTFSHTIERNLPPVIRAEDNAPNHGVRSYGLKRHNVVLLFRGSAEYFGRASS